MSVGAGIMEMEGGGSMSESFVWRSQVSQEMIDESGLSENEVGKLIEELDDAVARICEEFGIE